MDEKEKQYWYWLAKVEEVGGSARKKLFEVFGSAKEVFAAKESALRRAAISEKAVRALFSPRYREGVFEEFHKLQERHIYFVTKDEAAFPKRLKTIPDAPDFLFYRGELP